MDHRDREAIEDLFRRLAEVERRAGPRDREATALIRALIAAQPNAPYYMAQTIVVQQQALEAAQQRLDAAEAADSRDGSGARGGGFLDGLFGGSRGSQPRPAPAREPDRGPWGSGRNAGRGMGGGFLAGAAQTAMGVAGGVVLGNMLADLLTPDQAAAGLGDQGAAGEGGLFGGEETAADTQVADLGADPGGDFGGDFDVGDF